MSYPILENKDYYAPSIFTAENLLQEDRRQKSRSPEPVPDWRRVVHGQLL